MAEFGRMLRRHVAAMQRLVNDREATISEPRPGKSPASREPRRLLAFTFTPLREPLRQRV
jgi:hypothetical protein